MSLSPGFPPVPTLFPGTSQPPPPFAPSQPPALRPCLPPPLGPSSIPPFPPVTPTVETNDFDLVDEGDTTVLIIVMCSVIGGCALILLLIFFYCQCNEKAKTEAADGEHFSGIGELGDSSANSGLAPRCSASQPRSSGRTSTKNTQRSSKQATSRKTTQPQPGVHVRP